LANATLSFGTAAASDFLGQLVISGVPVQSIVGIDSLLFRFRNYTPNLNVYDLYARDIELRNMMLRYQSFTIARMFFGGTGYCVLQESLEKGE
jgi:hypothetical protein